MAEQMNLGSTLVLLTKQETKHIVLVNVDNVEMFEETGAAGSKVGGKIHFKSGREPFLVEEDPTHVKQLIMAAKKNEIAELMKRMVNAQKSLLNDIDDMLPPKKNPDDYPND